MQKIQTIKALYKSAVDKRNQKWGSVSGYFFTIDKNNKIEEWSLPQWNSFSTEQPFTNSLIIGCIHTTFQNYGWQNSYIKFAIISEKGEQINNIVLNRWTMSEIEFLHNKEPDKPFPEITFHLNSNPIETLKLPFFHGNNFQNAWNFFLELDKKCNSISEARFFYEYFELLYQNKQQDNTLKEYELQLEQKNVKINDYKGMMKKINELSTPSL